MEELSTKEYNELYKKYFKEIFNKPMKDFGFKKERNRTILQIK